MTVNYEQIDIALGGIGLAIALLAYTGWIDQAHRAIGVLLAKYKSLVVQLRKAGASALDWIFDRPFWSPLIAVLLVTWIGWRWVIAIVAGINDERGEVKVIGRHLVGTPTEGVSLRLYEIGVDVGIGLVMLLMAFVATTWLLEKLGNVTLGVLNGLNRLNERPQGMLGHIGLIVAIYGFCRPLLSSALYS